MSVVVSGRPERLTTPFLAEDCLARTDHAEPSGQEDRLSQMVQNLDLESGPEESSVCGSSCESSRSHRRPSTEILAEQRKRASFGRLKYGCSHYRRRCRIRAPCCGEIFDCRHCHNEVKNASERNPRKRHDLPRHGVESVICSICSTEQEVQQICKNCGVCMGEYFCGKCKFFDDEITKGQYHCDSCGICRIGGRDKFFHCQRCANPLFHVAVHLYRMIKPRHPAAPHPALNTFTEGCCYSIVLQEGHPCVEKAMHHNCPVCFEYLFDSMKDITVMACGHTMHLECFDEMQRHMQYSCPLCSKSTCDMTKYWEQLDREVAATPMPEAYQNKMVWILCNDCGVTSNVLFHIIAHKCGQCKSYNTRQTKSRPDQER